MIDLHGEGWPSDLCGTSLQGYFDSQKLEIWNRVRHGVFDILAPGEAYFEIIVTLQDRIIVHGIPRY